MMNFLVGDNGKDWKSYLAPKDEEKMNEILKNLERYRGAYRNASDSKGAQLWCAVLELSKVQSSLDERLADMEEIFETMFRKMRLRDDEKKQLMKSLGTF